MTEDSKAPPAAKEVKAEVTTEDVKGEVNAAGSKAAARAAAAESAPTLRQIFSLPEKEGDPADDHWKAFREQVSKEVKGVKWVASMPDLAPRVCELLDITIPDVLVTAWKKVEDLRKVLEESKQTPDKTVYLELAEHTIDYHSKPSIDVKIKRATVKKLELSVQLGFKLKGFVLKIQNGRIKEMQTGNCEAQGTIKYGSLTVAEKKLEPIKLPFSIQIPDEIPSLTPAPVDDERAEAKTAPSPAVSAPDEPLERIEL